LNQEVQSDIQQIRHDQNGQFSKRLVGINWRKSHRSSISQDFHLESDQASPDRHVAFCATRAIMKPVQVCGNDIRQRFIPKSPCSSFSWTEVNLLVGSL
jgi:hypothetical protein